MSSTPEAFSGNAPSGERGGRSWAWWLFAAISLWLAWEFVHLITLSRVVSWDEGFVMLSLRGFLDGHALYDDVFTQYGPGYYFLRAPLFLLLGLPLDHDTVRQLTMLTWLSTAGLLGMTAFRLTRTPLLGWVGFLLAVLHLSPLADEAGHPQELVVLLLAGLVLGHATAAHARMTWWMTAVVIALLLLMKINVGVFALLGLTAYGLCLRWPRHRSAPWLLPAIALLLPVGLMWRHLDQAWAMSYCLVAALAAAAMVATLLLTSERDRAMPALPLRSSSLVLLVSVAALLLATWLHGSSVAGMLDGLLLAPARFSGAFVTPLESGAVAIGNALLAALVWVGWLRRRHDARTGVWIGLAKLGFAVAGCVALLHSPASQLLYLAPWAWLALTRSVPHGDAGCPGAADDARRLVAAMAAFQLLQAYPVAGSQIAWATLLLLPLYIACLHDTWQHAAVALVAGRPASDTAAGRTSPPWLRLRLPERVAPLLRMLGGAALLWVCATLWMDLPRLRAYQLSLQSLDLPGARSIRIAPDGVALYRTLTRYLVENSDGFTSYPGYHNLHFWTRIGPPTQANATVWDLLSDSQQTAVVERLERYARPRIVLTRDVRAELQQRDRHALRPFERALLFDYEAVAEIGPCIILAPRLHGD